MRIEVFEKICDDWGGYYKYDINEDNGFTCVSWRTCTHALFPDNLKKIRRKLKKVGFELQYISYKSDGIGLEFVKR